MLSCRMPGGTGRGYIVASVVALALASAGCTTSSVPPSSTTKPVETPPKKKPVDASPQLPAPAIKKEAAKKEQPGPKVAQQAAAPKQPKAAVKPKQPVGPPAMPKVLMSEGHRKSCKVFVGDPLPDLELASLDGKKRKLSADYGKNLTVVCFFGGTLPSEEQELVDLTPEVVDRFGKEDVAVIGVAVGKPQDAVAALTKKTGVKFPVFIDQDRTAFKQVGQAYLPRTYLIDSTGKILWLDLEYSATTRRQLNEAIRHVLETK